MLLLIAMLVQMHAFGAGPEFRPVHTAQPDTVLTFVVGPQITSQVRIIYTARRADTAAFARDSLPWRLGGDDAPELFVSPTVAIGDLRIPEGHYHLATAGGPRNATLVVATGGGEIGRIVLTEEAVPTALDRLVVTFPRVRLAPDTLGMVENRSGSHATIQMNSGSRVSFLISWGHHQWSALVTAPDTVPHGRKPL